ncbi:MAG TPA: hypothetical protein VK540_08465 [Polyangiaceae bacterium]|nr:hypothetical protein [Polyangiaceae bacterium]
MKRFALALPVVAALALFCLPAWAADVAPDALPKNMVGNHLWVTLAAGVLPVLVKFFGNETVKLPYWAAKLRVAAVLVLGGIATVLDQAQNGIDISSAITAAVATTVPALLIELLQKFFAGGDVGPKSMRPPAMFPPPKERPPPGYSSPMARLSFEPDARRFWLRYPAAVGVAIGVCALVISGCAAKNIACPILRLAADACEEIVIILPDGSEERVPKSAIAGVAMSARAARVSGAKAGDAGADR